MAVAASPWIGRPIESIAAVMPPRNRPGFEGRVNLLGDDALLASHRESHLPAPPTSIRMRRSSSATRIRTPSSTSLRPSFQASQPPDRVGLDRLRQGRADDQDRDLAAAFRLRSPRGARPVRFISLRQRARDIRHPFVKFRDRLQRLCKGKTDAHAEQCAGKATPDGPMLRWSSASRGKSGTSAVDQRAAGVGVPPKSTFGGFADGLLVVDAEILPSACSRRSSR